MLAHLKSKCVAKGQLLQEDMCSRWPGVAGGGDLCHAVAGHCQEEQEGQQGAWHPGLDCLERRHRRDCDRGEDRGKDRGEDCGAGGNCGERLWGRQAGDRPYLGSKLSTDFSASSPRDTGLFTEDSLLSRIN